MFFNHFLSFNALLIYIIIDKHISIQNMKKYYTPDAFCLKYSWEKYFERPHVKNIIQRIKEKHVCKTIP